MGFDDCTNIVCGEDCYDEDDDEEEEKDNEDDYDDVGHGNDGDDADDDSEYFSDCSLWWILPLFG